MDNLPGNLVVTMTLNNRSSNDNNSGFETSLNSFMASVNY